MCQCSVQATAEDIKGLPQMYFSRKYCRLEMFADDKGALIMTRHTRSGRSVELRPRWPYQVWWRFNTIMPVGVTVTNMKIWGRSPF
jgi:hypothetical protein